MNLKVLPITNTIKHMIESGLPTARMPTLILWGKAIFPDNCYNMYKLAWIIYKGETYMYPGGYKAFKSRLSNLDRRPLRDCIVHAIAELIKEGYASKKQKELFFHDIQRRAQQITRQEALRFRPTITED